MQNVNKLINLATDPEQYTQGEATSWIDDSRRQQEQRERFWNAIKPFISPSCHSVLDVGCGSGWMAELLFGLGVDQYAGIEPSRRNFEITKREHPDLCIARTTLAEYTTNAPLDCILAIMVLSHMEDMDASFKKIFDLLNKEGIFISITSAFHEASHRHERNKRRYEVEVIDEDQYVDRSIEGTGYGIADINRRPEYYIREARKCGLSLMKHSTIEDKGYSPKELLVFQKPAPK